MTAEIYTYRDPDREKVDNRHIDIPFSLYHLYKYFYRQIPPKQRQNLFIHLLTYLFLYYYLEIYFFCKMKNQSAIKILFSKRITRHLVFWFLYLLVSTLIYGQPEKNFLQQFKWHLFYMPVVMGAVYFTIYYLLPEFLLKKKYIQFIIYLALSSLFFSFLQRANVYFIVIPFFNQSGDFYYPLFSFDVLFRIIKIYSVVTIAVAAKLVYIWYLNQQIREELEKES